MTADVIYGVDFRSKTRGKVGDGLNAVANDIWAQLHAARPAEMPGVFPDYGCSDVAYVAPGEDSA